MSGGVGTPDDFRCRVCGNRVTTHAPKGSRPGSLARGPHAPVEPPHKHKAPRRVIRHFNNGVTCPGSGDFVNFQRGGIPTQRPAPTINTQEATP